VTGDQKREVKLEAGMATWLAQDHQSENIGTT
jgi:hypothetical protein